MSLAAESCRSRAGSFFFGRRQSAFAWSPHLRLTCGPAGNRTATGSLSATSRTSPYQLLHRDACRSRAESVHLLKPYLQWGKGWKSSNFVTPDDSARNRKMRKMMSLNSSICLMPIWGWKGIQKTVLPSSARDVCVILPAFCGFMVSGKLLKQLGAFRASCRNPKNRIATRSKGLLSECGVIAISLYPTCTTTMFLHVQSNLLVAFSPMKLGACWIFAMVFWKFFSGLRCFPYAITGRPPSGGDLALSPSRLRGCDWQIWWRLCPWRPSDIWEGAERDISCSPAFLYSLAHAWVNIQAKAFMFARMPWFLIHWQRFWEWCSGQATASPFFSVQRRMASARSFNMFQSMLHMGLIDIKSRKGRCCSSRKSNLVEDRYIVQCTVTFIKKQKTKHKETKATTTPKTKTKNNTHTQKANKHET